METYSKTNTFQFNVLKQPKLMYVGSISKKEFFIDSHMHENAAEFVYIKNAKGEVLYNKTKYDISDNTILIINPNLKHTEHYISSNDNNIEIYYFAITDYIINSKKNSNIIPLSIPATISIDNTTFDNIKKTFFTILKEISQKKLGYDYLAISLCMQLYIDTLRLYNEQYNCFSTMQNENDLIIENVRQYILSNFSNPDLSISKLGEIFHLSNFYLSRLFKEKTGITIKDFLVQTRLTFAKEKLLTTKTKATVIAKEAGYNDIYHFFKSFKKYYNITPTELRMKQNQTDK